MPETPGHPVITEEWQIALLMVAAVIVAWGLTKLARAVARKIRRRDRD